MASHRSGSAWFWTPYSEQAAQVVDLDIHIHRAHRGPTTGEMTWSWGTARRPRAEFITMQSVEWPVNLTTRGEGVWCVHDILRAYHAQMQHARPRDPA